ncbi:MAG: hypothetical protein ACREHD_16725 [Pirellulales bacterium]
MSGILDYTARPGRGRMRFEYEVVRLWERPAEELLAGDVGVAPLAVLGRLPEGMPLEDAIAAVAQRVVERLIKEPPDRAKKLLTEALLLTGLRVKRDAAARIFRGVQMMEESDTFLMIIDRGQEKRAKRDILLVGEERLGPADDAMKAELENVSDLERLDRMVLRAVKATNWREILDTP